MNIEIFMSRVKYFWILQKTMYFSFQNFVLWKKNNYKRITNDINHVKMPKCYNNKLNINMTSMYHKLCNKQDELFSSRSYLHKE